MGTSPTSLAFAPDGETLAIGFADGSVELVPLGREEDDPRERTRLLGLPDGGWAVFQGEHRYRLQGDPAGRFWWSAGLCRFEPGELDGHGVEPLGEPA